MPSAKNKRKPVSVDAVVATRRNLKREIRKAEKKMAKLLSRNAKGLKRWELIDNRGRQEKKELNKLQGFAPESARHLGLKEHLNKMKSHLKELG